MLCHGEMAHCLMRAADSFLSQQMAAACEEIANTFSALIRYDGGQLGQGQLHAGAHRQHQCADNQQATSAAVFGPRFGMK